MQRRIPFTGTKCRLKGGMVLWYGTLGFVVVLCGGVPGDGLDDHAFLFIYFLFPFSLLSFVSMASGHPTHTVVEFLGACRLVRFFVLVTGVAFFVAGLTLILLPLSSMADP